MLLGGDYTSGVKGVGIVNGMEIMQAYPDIGEDVMGGLQKFKRWLDGFNAEDIEQSCKVEGLEDKERLFAIKHRTARTRWEPPKDFPSPGVMDAYLKPVVDQSRDRFSWGAPDVPRLHRFCELKLGWTQEDTDKLLIPIVERLQNRSHQTRLESYFMRYDDNIKVATVRSKRLREAMHGLTKEDDVTGKSTKMVRRGK